MNIAIVGLGLIGGSFAKAIKEFTPHTVIGLDADPNVLQQALKAGAIDKYGDDFTDADIVLLALYPEAIVSYIKEHASSLKKNALVIDLCGIKRYICENISCTVEKMGATFIGGHPMAGKENSGFTHASASLFCGASMILTPHNNLSSSCIERVECFFDSLGFSQVQYTTPEHHDKVIAFTSQLAHIVSSAYIKSPMAQEYMGFSAGSFRDLTRVAKLNPDMWTELFLLNRDYLAEQVEIIIQNLQAYHRVLEENDAHTLYKMLEHGSRIKESME